MVTYTDRTVDRSIRYFDPAGSSSLSSTIIEELAVVAGVKATDARRLLWASIDLEVLDALFRPQSDGTPREPGELVFAIDGYRITVVASGHIEISVLDGESSSHESVGA
jgi:hypothetical protein